MEPKDETPSWVHFDDRWIASGYPNTRFGSKGNYVLIAQDALNTLGYDTGGLDGIFGILTKNATIGYQNRNGLAEDGIIGPITWRKLMEDVVRKRCNFNYYIRIV